VKLRRLRAGELIALAGSVCIFVSLALPCYESPSGSLSAWATFDVAVVVLIVAAALGVALALATVTERSSAIPVATVVWTTIAGLAALVAALVRVLERPAHATGGCGHVAGARGRGRAARGQLAGDARRAHVGVRPAGDRASHAAAHDCAR